MDLHGTKACASDFSQGDSEGTELVWSLRILLIRSPNLEITTNPAFNKFRTPQFLLRSALTLERLSSKPKSSVMDSARA